MANTQPVIIEAAINGATTKERQPNVPRSREEVSTEIEAAFQAGASIVHNHPGDGATGVNGVDFYVGSWRPVIESRPDALLYPTLGVDGTFEERWGHVIALSDAGRVRIGPVDPGSVNLARRDESGLPARTEFVYENSPAYIRWQMDQCVERGLAPHFSIFEPGFLRVVLAYFWHGLMPPGANIRFYFSGPAREPEGQRGTVTFGLPPTETSLRAYLAMMDGCDLPWSVAVLGGDLSDSDLPRLALELGGHLRVGLEDYLGPRQPTNEDLIREMVSAADQAGRPVATCAQAAVILGLSEMALNP